MLSDVWVSHTHTHRLREEDAGLVIQGTCSHQFSELKVFPGNIMTLAAVHSNTVSLRCKTPFLQTQCKGHTHTSQGLLKLWSH